MLFFIMEILNAKLTKLTNSTLNLCPDSLTRAHAKGLEPEGPACKYFAISENEPLESRANC